MPARCGRRSRVGWPADIFIPRTSARPSAFAFSFRLVWRATMLGDLQGMATRAPRPARLASDRHLRQIVTQRHVLGEFLLGNSLLHLKLSVFHAADVAIDDADMVLLANDLVALRMSERIFHFHSFQRTDDALDVLARFIA